MDINNSITVIGASKSESKNYQNNQDVNMENEIKSHGGDKKGSNLLRIISSKSSFQTLGIILTLMSSLSKATASSLAKLSAMSVAVLGLYGGVVVLVITTILAIYKKRNLLGKKEDQLWLVFLSFANAGFLLSFYSVKYISVSQATVISFSSPPLAMFLARILLKEAFGVYECVLLVITLSGVVTVINPVKITSDLQGHISITDHVIGSAFAFAYAVMSAAAAVGFRKLKHYNLEVKMFWCHVPIFLVTTILIIIYEDSVIPISVEEFVISSICTVASKSNVIFLMLAVKYCDVTTVLIVKTSEVVFAAIFQLFLFNQPIITTTIVGIILVIVSIIMLNTKTWILNKIKLLKK